jgi:transcriptional regulator with XRE-family HTH domain
VVESSPTVRRRELGAVLRGLRTGKGLTVDQVAEALMCSSSKVSRMETGQRGATLRDVRDLCDLYGVTDQAERERLMSLAREAKQQGWWQPYDLPYSTYVGLEAEAVSIKDFDSAVIPGLLQTANYARALQQVPGPGQPLSELSPDVVDQRVEERLRRQKLLYRPEQPLNLWSILDEAALHRFIGGPAVMEEQLKQLIDTSQMRNVTIQVVPYSVGAHPGLDSTFNILEFAAGVPTIVYIEGLLGWIYLERAADVERYRFVFERLSEIALSTEQSVDLIAKISRAFATQLPPVGYLRLASTASRGTVTTWPALILNSTLRGRCVFDRVSNR